MVKTIIWLVLLCMSANVWSAEDPTFTAWLAALKEEARAKQISEATIEAIFNDAQYLPKVIKLDRSQPEFITTFQRYISRRVSEKRILAGRVALNSNKSLLKRVEENYGVPKEVLVAFWGLETNYGKNKGDYGLPSALMTLAYEGRRAAFFRKELFNMMAIVDAGHNTVQGMRGSWAGAMGHMQFMPSTFLGYAVDANADGRNDIWNSLPDAFSSAANYLTAVGWRKGEPIAIEVQLPSSFEYYQAQLKLRQHSRHWKEMGVVAADGQAIPALENTAIILPQGAQGPAFMVGSNFDVVMKWNRSTKYALSVSHLAAQLSGVGKPLSYHAQSDEAALSFDQAWAMQEKLNALGFDSGQPDGIPGTKTREAIRRYQLKHHLPADGYPSMTLFRELANQ